MFKVIIINLIVLDTILKYVIKNQNNTNNNKKKTSLPMWPFIVFQSISTLKQRKGTEDNRWEERGKANFKYSKQCKRNFLAYSLQCDQVLEWIAVHSEFCFSTFFLPSFLTRRLGLNQFFLYVSGPPCFQ